MCSTVGKKSARVTSFKPSPIISVDREIKCTDESVWNTRRKVNHFALQDNIHNLIVYACALSAKIVVTLLTLSMKINRSSSTLQHNVCESLINRS